MNPSKSLAIAALAGLLAGTTVACSGDTPAPEVKAPEAPAEVAQAPEAEQPAKIPEHACKGMNECKGQGACHVEGANTCAGANECKGKGGCCTMADKTACPEHDDAMGDEKTEAKGDAPASTNTAKSGDTTKGGRGSTEPASTVKGGRGAPAAEKDAPSTVKGGRGAPTEAPKEPSTVKGGR